MGSPILPRPTADDVIRAEKKFDEENGPIEWALTQLFEKFPDLKAGNPEIVDRIAKVQLSHKIRNNFSFASKYCHWHNPHGVPHFRRQR